jgi:hypothetical protein
VSAHSGMMEKPAEAAESGPRMFAMRKFSRRRLGGIATVFELSGGHFGGMHTLRRVEYSDAGVGGITDALVARGTAVTVGFQSRQCMAHLGRVVSCVPFEDGYHVGVAFK